MQNRFVFIFLVLGTLISSCSGQKSNEELILGTWEHEDKDREEFVYFQENGKVDIETSKYIQDKADYKIIDDTTLILGQRKYSIRELNDSILVLYSEHGYERFLRSDKVVDPIPEYIDVEDYYDNGQLRVKGRFHNGRRIGIWEEFYETDEKLCVQHFLDGGFPQKTQYFDKEGNEMSADEYYKYTDEHWPKAE